MNKLFMKCVKKKEDKMYNIRINSVRKGKNKNYLEFEAFFLACSNPDFEFSFCGTEIITDFPMSEKVKE